MENYNLVKLRSYVIRLLIGTAALIFGASVLYSILYEMLRTYDYESRYAYICGIISCVIILAIGLYFVVKALGFEKQLFQNWSVEEKQVFLSELDSENALFYDRYLFITRHYIMASDKSWAHPYCILKIDDLIGCFGRPFYASKNELVEYDVILYDKDFRMCRCVVKGSKAEMMAHACETITSLAPWVFSGDDYGEFMNSMSKKSGKRVLLKAVEHSKDSVEVTEDTISDVVISAADTIESYQEKKNQKQNPSDLLKKLKNE